jgi:hypothetical protein
LDVETILQALDEPFVSYQHEAMEAAVEQQAAITPRLLERLEAAVVDPEGWAGADGLGLLYTLALLSHFREPAAHPLVLRLARWPEAVIEPVLGDAITELLPVVLYQTRNGDHAGIRALLEDPAACGWCRGAAAETLAWCALFGELDRGELQSYFVTLLRDDRFAEPEDPAPIGVFHALLELYPSAYEGELRDWARGAEMPGLLNPEADIDYVFARGESDALADAREETADRLPKNVHDYLEHWAGFQPGFWDDEPEPDPFANEDWGQGPAVPRPEPARATKPKAPAAGAKKRKRTQQKQSRKTNRKRKK